jgi:hypothetical protein
MDSRKAQVQVIVVLDRSLLHALLYIYVGLLANGVFQNKDDLQVTNNCTRPTIEFARPDEILNIHEMRDASLY